MDTLTQRQQAIYDFVVSQVRARGIPPSLMEIAAEFGLTSVSGVSDHLKALERKGFIRRRPGISRGIEVRSRPAVGSPARRTVKVPILGDVPALGGLRSKRQSKRYLFFDGRVARGSVIAVRVNASGLEHQGILRGDFVIVERGCPPRRGEIGLGRLGRRTSLVEIGGERDQAVELGGDQNKPRRCEVLGRVIAVMRAMRELSP